MSVENPYPHGATLRKPVSWEEATLIRHWRKANERLEKARESMRSAMAEERAATNKLHTRGMLIANPAPEEAAKETA